MQGVNGDVPEERDDVGHAVLERQQHLERIASDEDRIALLYPVRIEDHRLGLEAVGEGEHRRLALHRSAAVREERTRPVVDWDRQPPAHDALRCEARAEMRARLCGNAKCLHGLVRCFEILKWFEPFLRGEGLGGTVLRNRPRWRSLLAGHTHALGDEFSRLPHRATPDTSDEGNHVAARPALAEAIVQTLGGRDDKSSVAAVFANGARPTKLCAVFLQGYAHEGQHLFDIHAFL